MQDGIYSNFLYSQSDNIKYGLDCICYVNYLVAFW